MNILALVASEANPLYKSVDDFKQQIYQAKTPEALNIVLDNFQKGKTSRVIHQLSDDHCRWVWNLIALRGRQLGFSRHGSDNTFYKPYQK